jgi:hypothetical protein
VKGTAIRSASGVIAGESDEGRMCAQKIARRPAKTARYCIQSIAVASQLFLGIYADHVQKHLRSGFKFDITGI